MVRKAMLCGTRLFQGALVISAAGVFYFFLATQAMVNATPPPKEEE